MHALDYFAIQNLIYRYADLLDRGSLDEAGALFDHADFHLVGMDGPLSRAGENRMTPVFREWMSALPSIGGKPNTRHVTTNLIIAPDGPGRAKTRAYVIVFGSNDALPAQPMLGGSYNDRFEKVAGAWRFAERRLQPFSSP